MIDQPDPVEELDIEPGTEAQYERPADRWSGVRQSMRQMVLEALEDQQAFLLPFDELGPEFQDRLDLLASDLVDAMRLGASIYLHEAATALAPPTEEEPND